MIHELPQLNYSYSDLEPHIDVRTMEVHHGKHHQAYINKLNNALKNYPDLQLLRVGELLKDTKKIPSKIRKAVVNNGGGHFNHSFFWQIMAKESSKEPIGAVEGLITGKFKSVKKFKEKFSQQAIDVFGSGWVWLVLDSKGVVKIITTQGHVTPIEKNLKPLLVLDVWEHAYYLKYQNQRAEYIENWWNVVNWKEVENNYQRAIGQIN